MPCTRHRPRLQSCGIALQPSPPPFPPACPAPQALNLLTGMPLWAGVLVTAVDVLILFFFEARSFRLLEVLVGLLIALISACFIFELVKAKPNMAKVGAAVQGQGEEGEGGGLGGVGGGHRPGTGWPCR